jgi:hypothetical protein
MSSFTLFILSGSSALALVLLFSVEQRRRLRFGEAVRTALDTSVERIQYATARRRQAVNEHFFQELYHFFVHTVMSFILTIIRHIENTILHIVRFNRMQVLRLRSHVSTRTLPSQSRATAFKEKSLVSNPEQHVKSHLEAIRAHKRKVELDEVEKIKRKSDSVMGRGPF